ncbi:MAG TPA: hypothetical protein VFS96_01770 [Nitrolancea sp.]|nr:hypothetical protein [Nitrolancea sp.]
MRPSVIRAEYPAPATLPTAAVPAPASGSDIVTLDNAAAQGTCYFETWGDNVHVSSFEASGHGWWENGNCPATLAVVTVQLQEYYSDGAWRNIGSLGQATVYSGGGGNRATGRVDCFDGTTTSWRSVVDVDLVGIPDDPGKYITPYKDIACRR